MSEHKRAARVCSEVVRAKRAVDKLIDRLLEEPDDQNINGRLITSLLDAQGELASAHQHAIARRLYFKLPADAE